MGCGASASKDKANLDAKAAEVEALQQQIKAMQVGTPAAQTAAAPTASPGQQISLPGTVTAPPDLVAKSDTQKMMAVQPKIQMTQSVDVNNPVTKKMLDDLACGLCGPPPAAHQYLHITDESAESKMSRKLVMRCMMLRAKYMHGDEPKLAPLAQGHGLVGVVVDGITEIEGLVFPPIPKKEDWRSDLVECWKICKNPAVKSLACERLERLSTTFGTHTLNHLRSEIDNQVELVEDVYSVMKVDNHIHLAAAMSPVQFLTFIRTKLKTEPDRMVTKTKTLRQVIQEAVEDSPKPAGIDCNKLDNEQLGLLIHGDSLRMCAGDHFYHRFDTFNSAYNPLGSGLLRTVFMKTSNDIGGSYFGELTHEIIASMERHHTYAEMRLSVYGKSPAEWDDLARWIKASDLHKPIHTRRNLWMVQIPRVYKPFFEAGFIKNFEEFINNIFQALFEVALDPTSHPDLAEVLPSIVGFDCVDDESVSDPLCARRSQVYGDNICAGTVDDALLPKKWAVSENPPYSYYAYYLYANLKRFNDLCKMCGRPWKIAFRPHAGEAGEIHHLATTFLIADGINHGINLKENEVLQYLYMLCQIGVSVAPMSNNSLFLKMKDNPFPLLFRRGLNVSLSTDDPLMFHSTNQPLLEEYTCARLVFGLSSVDLCEIAANSVRQSGFPLAQQAEALGDEILKQNPTPYRWNPMKCNIPERRLRYRRAQIAANLRFLRDGPDPVPDVLEPTEDPMWLTHAKVAATPRGT